MNRPVTIVAVTEDMILSTRIAKICNDSADELIFSSFDNLVQTCNNIEHGIALIQLDSIFLDMPEYTNEISKINHMTIIGYMEDFDNDLRKKAINSGFEIVFPSSGIIRNLTVIIQKVKINLNDVNK
jgi:hypothetical protein